VQPKSPAALRAERWIVPVGRFFSTGSFAISSAVGGNQSSLSESVSFQ
jgi:hypothetical protein